MNRRLLICLAAAFILSACVPSLGNLQEDLGLSGGSDRPSDGQLAQLGYTTPGEIETIYAENILDANKKYQGKWAKVRGTIAASPSEYTDALQTEVTGYGLVLEDEKKVHKTRFASLICNFPPDKATESALRSLKLGQTITVGGRFSEYKSGFSGPTLEDCVILQK